MSNKNFLHPGKSGLISSILYFIGKYIYKVRFNIKAKPNQSIQTSGPILVLSKHCSNHDIVAGLPVMVDYLNRKDAWCIIKNSLTKPIFLGFFFKIGGIPIDRENPILSKQQLLYSRKILHEGNLLVLFPEQSRHPRSMGEGKSAGFRFIMGKPSEAVKVICVGIEYKNTFPRRTIEFNFGEIKEYSKKEDPEIFLKNCMVEIAKLSNLEYPF